MSPVPQRWSGKHSRVRPTSTSSGCTVLVPGPGGTVEQLCEECAHDAAFLAED